MIASMSGFRYQTLGRHGLGHDGVPHGVAARFALELLVVLLDEEGAARLVRAVHRVWWCGWVEVWLAGASSLVEACWVCFAFEWDDMQSSASSSPFPGVPGAREAEWILAAP
jgi:hypothetical protein